MAPSLQDRPDVAVYSEIGIIEHLIRLSVVEHLPGGMTYAHFELLMHFHRNGDGQIDTAAIAYVQGESEAAYVQKITTTYRSTLRDANGKLLSASATADYIQSDNTHPTYTGATISIGFIGGSGSGSGAPDYTDAQIVNGKNPVWNLFGHERMGHAIGIDDGRGESRAIHSCDVRGQSRCIRHAGEIAICIIHI